jgi:integrase
MPRARSRLFRRKQSPFWQASWTDADGRSHEQSTGCRDHGAASLWLAAREIEKASVGAGVPVARPKTILEAAADYLEEKEPLFARKWWQTVEGFVRLQVVPQFGPERLVSSIGPGDIAKFRAAQMQRRRVSRRKKPLPAGQVEPERPLISPSTVNRLFWAMAAFGEWAVERKYATSNPWSVESLPESQLPVPAVEEEQLARVVLALPGRWRPLVELARETGLRKSELSRLRWSDYDEAERTLWVVSAHGRGLTKSRKTRPVPVSRRAAEVLKALPRRVDGMVFGKVGDPRRAFRTAARAAGLERVWMHLFRHVAASSFAAKGATPADLVAFGGWSGSRMVDKYVRTHHRRMLAVMDAPILGDTTQAVPPAKEEGGSR